MLTFLAVLAAILVAAWLLLTESGRGFLGFMLRSSVVIAAIGIVAVIVLFVALR